MKNKIISLLLLILFTLVAISCNQEVIFYDVAREVKLVNPEINGNIYSMVPLDGKLYVQNGSIYEKEDNSVAHGWKRFENPPANGRIIRLASDGNTLYAMDEGKNVWARTKTSSAWEDWKKIASDVQELFDSQKHYYWLGTGARAAYINTGSEVKLLKGKLDPVPSPLAVTDVMGKDDSAIKAAVHDGSQLFFSSNPLICASGSTLYAVTKGETTVQYKTQGGSWMNGGSVHAGALSICAYGTDKLLIGTENGYEICTIDSSTKAPSSGIESATNAETAFGTRQVVTIKAFNDSVYAAVVSSSSSEYSKLWGWFGTDWNYE